jgi:monoamine oxidase
VYPGETGSKSVRTGPVPTLSQVLSWGVGEAFKFETDYKQAMVMLQPVGGMDAIPMALAREVGAGRIKLGSVVTSVTNGPEQVGVKYRDASGQEKLIEADYCVATLPPLVMAKVPHNLGPDVQRGLTAFEVQNAGKIGLEYRSRFWETDHRIYGGITETDLDITHIWYPSTGFHSQRGILTGYYNTGDEADIYSELNHVEREARAIAQGMKIHGPKHRTELAASFSVAWNRVPHIEGGWMKIPGGPEAPVYAPLNRPVGRVYFAGDWLSHVVSWQHGSLVSVRKVVTDLHNRVMTTAA